MSEKKCGTIIECSKCGRREHVNFEDGLRNGWAICCGYTMRIVEHHADIEKAVENLVREARK